MADRRPLVRDAIGQALICICSCICSREDAAMASSLMRGLSALQTAGMAALGTSATLRTS